MNASYTALLMASCISLSLYSMEDPNQSLSGSTLNNSTTIQIGDIPLLQAQYTQTYDRLEAITSRNNTAANTLLEIIEKTDQLKSHGITEHQMGAFAFNQAPSFKNQFFNRTHTPYNGPHYISVFFALLKEYNDLLNKHAFTTPTIEQLANYKNNQSINATIQTAASFNLHIDATPLKEKNIFKDISDTVAIPKFNQLITDICIMRCKSPVDIEAIATLLYGPIDAKK
jgi:hypothetical protein